ncbi:hypothetical protein [Natrinema caseinilyticum]|uniref:hypothetical protein n=1 Tax=Natrinema caseinilyticum TaxID=2961570 RepID=UPI0020C48ACD|nr:hypothetical protein [Natrinema caseinilyticum]
MTASPLLYVGAITIVGAHELLEWLPLSEPAETLVLLPITLLRLSAQLMALAYTERKGYRRDCTATEECADSAVTETTLHSSEPVS